jgi:hypothetical protein
MTFERYRPLPRITCGHEARRVHHDLIDALVAHLWGVRCPCEEIWVPETWRELGTELAATSLGKPDCVLLAGIIAVVLDS